MRYRPQPLLIFTFVLFVLLLCLTHWSSYFNRTIVIDEYRGRTIRVETAKSSLPSNPCYSFINDLPLPPVTSSGKYLDIYLIDEAAIRKLRRDCRTSLTLPLSVMIEESQKRVYIDRSIYNVTYFVKRADYFFLKTKPERVLLKLDFHRVGSLLLPSDSTRFLQYWERSVLVKCLGKDMHRKDMNTSLPAHFENKMAEIRDELINMGAMPFITGGTLLGWYRECTIIPHTMDVDFGVLYQDYRPQMTEQLKNLKHFDLFKKTGKDHDSLEFTIVAHEGGPIDIFIVYDEDDERVYTAGVDKFVRSRFKWILPKAKGYCSGILHKKLFFVPCNTLEIIEAEYGKKWALDHPTAKFNWWESNANVVSNGEFTEEEMKKYYIQYY